MGTIFRFLSVNIGVYIYNICIILIESKLFLSVILNFKTMMNIWIVYLYVNVCHYDSEASWTPKFDGNLRPRAGLVYVEPKVYDEVLKEERRLKRAYLNESRSQRHNLTLDDDAYLENIES
ncbi:hypothetical protein KUTeg_013566 [Tegillarca granosa]|uniref:Uncharacterized protein n=1 Tax=Tegillarca granosa TaxID=220873 RepID=A0ABQ9EU31_TEGGR|nr:hypothetical protein KUTeg_013566 [Tegillarca granosa]